MASKTKQWPIVKNHKGTTTGGMGRGIVHHATVPLPSHWITADKSLNSENLSMYFGLSS
jgi:hypothetical protein